MERTTRRTGIELLSFLIASALCVALTGCPGGNTGGIPTSPSTAHNQSGTTGGNTTTDDGSGSGSGSGDGGSILPGGNGSGGDGGAIQQYKPALAIRASGCILCHANVASTIITDFGNGDSFFFGGGASGLTPFSGSIYGDHAQNWATARVYGSILVPKANIDASLGIPAMTLADYLSAVVTAPDSMTAKPTVTAESSVYIGAPTQDRIQALGQPFPLAHPQWNYFPSNQAGDITGLTLRTNGYVENTGEVDCNGDLVVDSVLFLNNLQLRTNNGCRIYATHSVFIQGPITYLGTSPLANLQITSSRAIILGLGQGPVTINQNDPTLTNNSLEYRFQDFWTRGGYFTREMGTVQDKLDTIVNESLKISDLTDAELQPTGRAVAFSHLLLNAPNIQSRYQGQFSGVIIAEVVITSLNTFQFVYDNVFSNVPVLPLIKEAEYLSLTK